LWLNIKEYEYLKKLVEADVMTRTRFHLHDELSNAVWEKFKDRPVVANPDSIKSPTIFTEDEENMAKYSTKEDWE
jgi:hypothetical protein